MLVSYAAVFAFGLLLLGSWAGWGAAIHRLLFRQIPADRALHAGWGLAFALVVGGVLNLSRATTPAVIYLFSGTGATLLLIDGLRRQRRLGAWARGLVLQARQDWLLTAAAAVLCGLVIVLYAASVRTTVYNFHDDLQGYFVFPTKMIQTGSLGPDPFSERRILLLGGMSFLHACVLSVADQRYISVVDAGAGLLLCVALLLAIARDARTNAWARIAGLLLFLSIPQARANTTSLMTGLALFLTLFLTLYRGRLRHRLISHATIPVALAAAGLCILKTTFLPACVLLIVGTIVLDLKYAQSTLGAVFRRLALVAGLTLLCCAPWMASLYSSNGTLLYPFLGRGFHGSAYGAFWQPSAGVTLANVGPLLLVTFEDLRVIPLFLLGAIPLLRRDLAERRGALVAWFLAATIASLAVPLVLGGDLGRYRYCYSFLYAAMFTLLSFALADSAADVGWRRARTVLGGLAIAVLLLAHGDRLWSYWRYQFESSVNAVRMGPKLVVSAAGWESHRVAMKPYARSYAKMQAAVPEGATLLARLEYPFLLDFRRNVVYIVDYPGGSSPPPGMPFFQGGESLGEYLCRQGLRYVAYSYSAEAGFPKKIYRARLIPGMDPWIRMQAQHTLDFQRSLGELSRTRSVIFDNGDVYVLDLGLSADRQTLHCAQS
jgi:hypothetical protein